MHSKLGLAIGAIAITAIALTGCSGAAPETPTESVDSPGVTATTISIGTISDQTGPTAGIQLPWLHGLQAQIGAVNDAGGINDRQIELLSEDDKYDVAVGQPAFKKLVSQTPVAAMLGLNTGNVQAAITPLIEQSGVPLISGQATTKDAVSPTNPYFFGLPPTYADQADVMIAYAQKTFGDDFKIAVINNGTATGIEVVNLIKERAVDGIDFVGEVVIEPGAPSVDAQLQTIIGMDPDIIVYHGTSSAVNLLARAQEKFDTHYPLIGIAPSGGPAAFAGATPEFGNLYEYVQWATPFPIEEDGTAALVAAAKAAGYDAEVNNPDFVAGYAAGLVITQAITDAGVNPNRDSIRDALEGLTDFSTGNLTPNVSFGPDDHVGVQLLRPIKWNYDDEAFEADGTYEEYADAISNEYLQ
jgi:branched-chain amino acid transport system substrate-binding protein